MNPAKKTKTRRAFLKLCYSGMLGGLVPNLLFLRLGDFNIIPPGAGNGKGLEVLSLAEKIMVESGIQFPREYMIITPCLVGRISQGVVDESGLSKFELVDGGNKYSKLRRRIVSEILTRKGIDPLEVVELAGRIYRGSQRIFNSNPLYSRLINLSTYGLTPVEFDEVKIEFRKHPETIHEMWSHYNNRAYFEGFFCVRPGIYGMEPDTFVTIREMDFFSREYIRNHPDERVDQDLVVLPLIFLQNAAAASAKIKEYQLMYKAVKGSVRIEFNK